MRITLILAILAACLLPLTSHAEEPPPAPPVYSAEFAGPGQSVAVNRDGVVVGNQSITQPGQPWV